MKESKSQTKTGSLWQKTQHENLVRYVPRGTYYARLRVGGKLIRRCLKTKSMTVAKLKLGDLEKQERAKIEGKTRLMEGKASMEDLAKAYLDRLDANPALKPRTRTYWRERLAGLRKSWPGFDKLDARKITENDCRDWATRFQNNGARQPGGKLGASPIPKTASASNYNNTVALLKNLLALAVEQGIRYSNPAACLGRMKVKGKVLSLPSQNQFHELLEEIRRVPFGPGLASADLVEFLAYGGMRVKSEAAYVMWADCDFEKGEIIVRGHEVHGTKNWTARRVPMIPDMRRLLERLRAERPGETPDQKVMRVAECQGAIDRACTAKGIPRFTHHDLRHLFATRCIESGVDIPTVSRWLGHKDGGALAMKVYGHLRDQHSASMAAKVTFAAEPTSDKIIKLEAIA